MTTASVIRKETGVFPAYDVVRRMWRTTEAFDAVRGSMPPDGIFLSKGYAYFVTQSIVMRIETQEKDLTMFVRPAPFGTESDYWIEEEEPLKVETVRQHPYRHLGPRPNSFHRLFDGKGATLREVDQLCTGGELEVTIDRDEIRHYLAKTAGTRGNGDSGYVELTTGETLTFRFIRTPRKQPHAPAEHAVSFPSSKIPRVTVGISPAALLYALRFLDKNIQFSVRDGKINFADPKTGTHVILSTRSK